MPRPSSLVPRTLNPAHNVTSATHLGLGASRQCLFLSGLLSILCLVFPDLPWIASRPLLLPQYGIPFLCGHLMSAIVRSSRYPLLCGFPFSFPTSRLRAGLRAAPVTLIFISSLLWRAQASHEAYLRVRVLPFFLTYSSLFFSTTLSSQVPFAPVRRGRGLMTSLCPVRFTPLPSRPFYTHIQMPLILTVRDVFKGSILRNVEAANHRRISSLQSSACSSSFALFHRSFPFAFRISATASREPSLLQNRLSHCHLPTA
jgi:hypothetical protein